MKKTLLLLGLMTIGLMARAQQREYRYNTKIKVNQDVRLEKLERHKNKLSELNRPKRSIENQLNRKNYLTNGYRIHIYTGSDKEVAQKKRLDFISSYPETPCYIHYKNADYKISVGDFISKVEADEELNFIRSNYLEATVIPARVYRR